MPGLNEHQSAQTAKLLLIGDSGSGKTGSLASLAKAGYKLAICDLDNGLDVLANLLRSDPAALARVEFETFNDSMKAKGNKIMPASASAWGQALDYLQKLIDTRGPETVIVIDSLTLLSRQAMYYVLKLENRLNQPPQIQDWGAAMSNIERLLEMLYSDEVTANVIITSHISYIGADSENNDPGRGYPSTLGQKLPPKVGRYFNAILMTKSSGTGSSAKRRIYTTSQGNVECKTPMPTGMPASFDLNTGLAEYFEKVLGRKGPA